MRVRLHLAKLESSDEWKKLEDKMAKLESRAREIGSVTAEASEDMGAAAKMLAELPGAFEQEESCQVELIQR